MHSSFLKFAQTDPLETINAQLTNSKVDILSDKSCLPIIELSHKVGNANVEVLGHLPLAFHGSFSAREVGLATKGFHLLAAERGDSRFHYVATRIDNNSRLVSPLQHSLPADTYAKLLGLRNINLYKPTCAILGIDGKADAVQFSQKFQRLMEVEIFKKSPRESYSSAE